MIRKHSQQHDFQTTLAPARPRGRCAAIAARLPLWAAAAFILFGSAARAQMATFDPVATKPDRALTISIVPTGFRPNKVGVKAGNVALFIENRSLVENLTIAVTADGQTTAALTSQHSRKQPDVWHFVHMQPGTYHLSVAQFPAWQCTLVVIGN
jgi:hypothetical protein